jgi:hypothetical protein
VAVNYLYRTGGRVFVVLMCLMAICLVGNLFAADELYMITTRDGATIIAREYRFKDDLVEFTTENGLPGYIKKDELNTISNMVGVSPGEAVQMQEKVSRKERSRNIVLGAGAVLAIILAILLVVLSGKKKKNGDAEKDIHYGRKEKEPATQGHLSFDYKGSMGRIARWTIEVRSAYEEEGILFIEGICTTTDKRKTFRADRVVGPVTDMSNEHHAPMDHFFVDAAEE